MADFSQPPIVSSGTRHVGEEARDTEYDLTPPADRYTMAAVVIQLAQQLEDETREPTVDPRPFRGDPVHVAAAMAASGRIPQPIVSCTLPDGRVLRRRPKPAHSCLLPLIGFGQL
jgi:hypothetical protein